jgi:Zn-dependent protease with chaperone function
MRSSRAWIALAVLVFFPVVVLGLLGFAGWVAFLVLDNGQPGAGSRLLLYIAIPVLVGIAAGALSVAMAKPRAIEGYEVTREEHPALWAEFNQSARAARTARADRAVITLDVNAAVRQVSGNRELVIGLPLLGMLTVPQLRAVLAHEFGHFGAGHARGTALTWRANTMLHEISAHSGGVGGILLRLYARFYAAAAAASSRDQEWQADEYAARLATPSVGAAALRRVAAAQIGWEWLSTRFLPLAAPAERRPPIVQGLRAVMAANPDLLGASVTQTLESSSTGMWSSSHPPMKERIMRFEQWAGYPVVGGDVGEPAATLLTGGEAAFDAIERTLTGNEDPPAPWAEVVQRAGAAVVAEEGNALRQAAVPVLQVKNPNLDLLLATVGRGEGLSLVATLVDPGVARSQRQRAEHEVLIHTLSSVIASELIVAGKAHHELDWTVMWRLVDSSGTLLPIEAEVATAVADPSRIPPLRDRLRELGITSLSDTAIIPSAPSQRVPAGLISRVSAPQTEEEVDLLVFDDGLLLVPVSTPPASGRDKARKIEENARLDSAFTGTFREWRGRPGAGWLEESDIVGAGITDSPTWTLTLELSDGGDPIVLERTSGTVQRGPAIEALSRMLGTRMRA